MKRFLLLFALCIFCTGLSEAQTKKVLDLPKYSFGVRAGFLTQNIQDAYYIVGGNADNFMGCHVGGTFEVAMNSTRRWFFQTGVDFQYQTSEGAYGNNHLLFMEIPVMFAPKFCIGKNVTLYPSFGLSYTVGLWGKLASQYGDVDAFDIFSDFIYNIDRHGANLRLGVNTTFKNFYLGVGVRLPIGLRITRPEWSCNITLGYNF